MKRRSVDEHARIVSPRLDRVDSEEAAGHLAWARRKLELLPAAAANSNAATHAAKSGRLPIPKIPTARIPSVAMRLSFSEPGRPKTCLPTTASKATVTIPAIVATRAAFRHPKG